VPRKPRPRARPQAQRKKARHRYTAPPPTSHSEGGAAAAPRVVPFPTRSRPAVDTTPAPPRVQTYDYSYVLRELRRIVIIGLVMLLLVVISSFMLR
jgi:hypothetical protein